MAGQEVLNLIPGKNLLPIPVWEKDIPQRIRRRLFTNLGLWTF